MLMMAGGWALANHTLVSSMIQIHSEQESQQGSNNDMLLLAPKNMMIIIFVGVVMRKNKRRQQRSSKLSSLIQTKDCCTDPQKCFKFFS
jgi:hypothetical protein